jgi:hypothetical protein
VRGAVVAALLTSCAVDERTAVLPPIEQARVDQKTVSAPVFTKIDFLIVVDHAPAFAPYADRVAAQLAGEGIELMQVPGDIDLHVGVISSDLGLGRDAGGLPAPGECAGWGDAGGLLHSPLADGNFISIRRSAVSERTNVRTSVGAALVSLADLRTANCTRTSCW